MIVDLSHEIASVSRGGASGDTGLPTPVESPGTRIESPYQCHADRADLAQLPLERLVNVPIVVVRAFGSAAVTATDLGDPGRLWGRAVLVHTRWARYWGTRRYLDSDCPHLTA